MSQSKTNVFTHRSSQTVSVDDARTVWKRWSELSTWQDWDSSLKGTSSKQDGLELGKQFSVLPKGVDISIPVVVSAYIESKHFTTTSSGPMGMLSFGHTITPHSDGKHVDIEHTLCALPANPGEFAIGMWARLMNDIDESVGALSQVVAEGEVR